LAPKANGGLHENEVVQEFDDVERAWLANGTMVLSNGKELTNVGRIEDTGLVVDRARRIMRRIVPPYVDATHIRVHVVDSDEWNARAMCNGAIWVNTGLLNDASDDELAVVLGHELAHYTYEHMRQSVKDAKRSLLAWENGYGRNLEDQADRVGLRYAYEGVLMSNARLRCGRGSVHGSAKKTPSRTGSLTTIHNQRTA
jgi:hypothetical protein